MFIICSSRKSSTARRKIARCHTHPIMSAEQIEEQQRTHPAPPTLRENLLSHPLCVLLALSCGARCKIVSVHTIPATKRGSGKHAWRQKPATCWWRCIFCAVDPPTACYYLVSSLSLLSVLPVSCVEGWSLCHTTDGNRRISQMSRNRRKYARCHEM